MQLAAAAGARRNWRTPAINGRHHHHQAGQPGAGAGGAAGVATHCRRGGAGARPAACGTGGSARGLPRRCNQAALLLISSWLEAEHFGIELDEACMLSVGPGTAPQQAHSDVPEMIYLGDEFFGLQVGDRALRARPKSWQNMLKGRSTFNLNGTYSTVGPHAAVDAAAAAESDGAVIYAYLRD